MAGRGGGEMKNLTIEHVTKEFTKEDGSVTIALEDINLEIKDEEFICFVGPSGCGKTTLLRIIAGLETATSGEIRLNDTAIEGPDPKRGMVFQEYSLFPWRRVIDNITFGLEMQGVPKGERQKMAEEYLAMVGLAQFRDAYPFELSGGMRQRVAIARALANDPDVLLMDEPFGALDAQTRNLMQTELLEIWEETKKTVLFVTHSVDEAVYLGDRIVVLSARPGRVCEIIDIDMERPRDRTSAEFASVRRHVLGLMQRCTISQ
jgi:NitT/TauT family transport system ATP-binding protein